MDKKVSIIIPVYNVEKYLRQCLDSVVNQTFKDFECICINDGSTDNSYNILKEYVQKDNRFTVINLPENKGQGNARNRGLKIAKGKYIIFIDSDDWVKENHIEQLYNNIEKNNTDVVIAEIIKYDNAANSFITNKNYCYYNKTIKSIADKKKLVLSAPMLLTQSLIINKNFIINNNLFFSNQKIGEDFLFFIKIIACNSSFIYIKSPIYYYRINREGSLMTNFYENKNLDYITLFNFFDKIIDIFKQQNVFELYKKELYVYLFLYFSREVTDKQLTIKEYFKVVGLYKKFFYQKNLYFFKVKNIKNKIRLFVFAIHLKFGINFVKTWKLIKKFRIFSK